MLAFLHWLRITIRPLPFISEYLCWKGTLNSSQPTNQSLKYSSEHLGFLWSPFVADVDIIFYPCCFYISSSFSLSFFLVQSQLSHIGCLPYFYTWCCLSVNLECMSEMCCTWLAENTGRKNCTKNRHLCTIAQLCPAVLAIKACIDNRKKNSLNSNISSRCAHNMVNFSPLTADICWRVCGTPANFNRFCVLASLLQRRHSPEANQTLHDLLHWYTIYTFLGALAPLAEFSHVQNWLCVQVCLVCRRNGSWCWTLLFSLMTLSLAVFTASLTLIVSRCRHQ